MKGRNILAVCVAASAITVLTACGTNMEQRAATGITGGLVRLSIGLEDVQDLRDDVLGALDAVVRQGVDAAKEVTSVR